MLVAITKQGTIISLGDKFLDKQKLLKLREVKKFYCPVCKQEVVLKLGTKLSWHFAHKKNSRCHEELEGETVYHINGKKLLYEWLKIQGFDVHLEAYIKEAKQRPDLLVHIEKNTFAIEFQCAKISPELFLKRTNTYRTYNYIPIWILGGNQLTRDKGNFFKLNSFHWLFTYHSKLEKDRVQLLTFCPQNKQFGKLHNITPLSVNRSFAFPTFFPLDKFHFYSIFKPHSYLVPKEIWYRTKSFWRQHRLRLSQSEQYVRDLYIRKGHPLWLFPSEAGVPSPSYYFIETPTYIWQSWILETFVVNRNPGERFHFTIVKRAFHTVVQKAIFRIRTLPLIEFGSWEIAVQNYLLFLCTINVLTTTDGQLFVKKKDIVYPKNIEQALIEDKQLVVDRFKERGIK
ncbi:competence protein CoiA [Anaerobacillus alkalilacustris]|uniref:competence protein CoiA n=1 Tax=Anaerobacillus alkalilacustris TaxID=393763 RepID=UPI001471FECA|nr:competence protein CoiA family protein [Anaerobacillus alkalilacustris]